MQHTRSFVAACALLAVLSSASCELFTGPGESPFEGQLDGQILGTQGRPFGFGISRRGAALALQLDMTTAAQFDIHADTVEDFVPLYWDAIDVAFTSNGNTAYVTTLQGTRVYKVNMSSGAISDSVTFGNGHHRILMHPDDSKYWVFGVEGTVWAVNRVTGALTDSVAFPDLTIHGVSRRASDGSIAMSAGPGVIVLNGGTLDMINGRFLGGLPQEVVHSKDGNSIFVAMEDQARVFVLDATTLAVSDTIAFTDVLFSPFGMRLSPDGHTLLVSSAANGQVAVIDADARTVTRTLTTGGIPRRIAFSPNGQRAFVTNEWGWIDVIR